MCVSTHDHRDECDYQRKLAKGLNFFKGKDLYLEIKGRMFHIGKRSDYHRDTRPLNQQEREDLKGQFKDGSILWHEGMLLEKCVDEKFSDTDRAVCRVFLSIGQEKYNIHNYNGRAVTEKTAFTIRDFLRKYGIGAAVEYVGTKVSKAVVPQEKTEPKIPETRKKIEVRIVPKAVPMVGKQISFDEFLGGMMVS
jgi:sulfur carrier protein ThiS